MKPTFAFSCALALLAIVSVANAKSMCTPMDGKDKAMYEGALETDFMGCQLTMKESMTALSRMNWMTPAGAAPMVEMDTDADIDMTAMGKSKDVKMATTGMKVAAASLSRSGMMTVSSECLLSLPPDFVASCMAKSKTPKEYNAHLAAECKANSVRTINTASRATVETQATAEAVICLLTLVLSIFFPLPTVIIDTLKMAVTTVFTILPCPSVAPITT